MKISLIACFVIVKIHLELQLYAVIVLLLKPITKMDCDIFMK